MKLILFGATGMVGQGVLRECLLDPAVEQVLCIGRNTTGRQHPKLRQIVHKNLFDLAPLSAGLAGFDACLYCLGVSSVGMPPGDYRHITYDLTLSVARTLLAIGSGGDPALVPADQPPPKSKLRFVFVSGASTDSTQQGRVRWARVKGATENALLKLPFTSAHGFRPGYIQPMHGVVARTPWLRIFYKVMGPLYPLWRVIFPGYVTTTEVLGRAMLRAAKGEVSEPILEVPQINAIGSPSPRQ